MLFNAFKEPSPQFLPFICGNIHIGVNLVQVKARANFLKLRNKITRNYANVNEYIHTMT